MTNKKTINLYKKKGNRSDYSTTVNEGSSFDTGSPILKKIRQLEDLGLNRIHNTEKVQRSSRSPEKKNEKNLKHTLACFFVVFLSGGERLRIENGFLIHFCLVMTPGI